MGNNQALTRGLEELMVPHNEKAVRGDYDIIEVAFHITNFGSFLRRSDTLAKVRVCSPEVRALQLGTLPGSTTSEGHLGEPWRTSLTERLRTTEPSSSTTNSQIWQLDSRHSCGFRLA